jgi:hypothetical protein
MRPSRRFFVLVITGVVAGTVLAPSAAAATRSFRARADTYVDSSRPRANYGGAAVIRVGRRPARRAYVRFRVAHLGGSVENATLLLFVKRGSAPSLRVRRVTNRWRESSITWRRQPRLRGRAVLHGRRARPGVWTSVDVTSFVEGSGRYSFRISSRTRTDVALTSSGARGPRLKVKVSPPGSVVWSADHETGDMSQWPRATLNWDSGDCLYHGVSRDYAHSGSYSMKLAVDTRAGKAGCRQARLREIQTGGTFVYSIWYYLPGPVLTVNNHWNVFQFKSKRGTLPSEPIWTIDFQGNPLRPVLAWKGGNYGVAGPQASNGVIGQRDYPQALTTVPIGRWTHLAVYLDQSPDFDGRITVWHDGVKIFDIPNVRTRFPDGDARWVVNNYSNGLTVNPFALYLDDAAIAVP